MKYKTGDKAPVTGRYQRIETGEIFEMEKGDMFPPYYKKIGEAENGAPIYRLNPERAHYKTLGS